MHYPRRLCKEIDPWKGLYMYMMVSGGPITGDRRRRGPLAKRGIVKYKKSNAQISLDCMGGNWLLTLTQLHGVGARRERNGLES